MSTNQTQDLVKTLTEALIAEGKLIEAGFASYRLVVMSKEAPEIQVRECRFAFFAGAQHLFGSLMQTLDPEAEPTEADMERMRLISEELERFVQGLKARARANQGATGQRPGTEEV